MTSSLYRPRILRHSLAEDAKEIADLRRQPGTLVHDSIRQQVSDLVRTRNPAVKLDGKELEAAVNAHLRGAALEDYGVWVDYPWSHRLVHLLDEAEFVELRTDRNHYKITPEEESQLALRRIGIVGLSVGQSIALTLALERVCGELRLADFDHIDLSNLNRLRCGVHSLGLPKVYVTAREIAEFDPFLRVVCYPEGWTDTTAADFTDGLDLLIDECDSLDVKLTLRRVAREKRLPVLMNTSDRGMTDVERFDLEPDRPIFHGLMGSVDPRQLQGLSSEDKVPHIVRMLQAEAMSPSLRASFLEVERSIKTWPQLASDVTLGGAVLTNVSRRILLGHPVRSGRYLADLDDLLGNQPLLDLMPAAAGSEVDCSAGALAEASSARTLNEGQEPSVIRSIVRAATLAPSGGNTQPWHWTEDGNSLSLHLKPSASRSLLDFEHRASLLALGAAAENAVMAAHHHGQRVHVELFPDSTQPDLIAVLDLDVSARKADESRAFDQLYEHIFRRRTKRKRGRREPLPGSAMEKLEAAVYSVEGAGLKIIQHPPLLDELGDIIGEGERLRLLDPALHAELMSELRWTRAQAESTRDGISLEELELRPAERVGIEICRDRRPLDLLRSWNRGSGFTKMSREAVASASALGLVTMPTMSPRDYFLGGRAVERLWLTAESLEIGFQPMTAICYLFARLESAPETLDETTRRGLLSLRGRFAKLFALEKGMAEIMLFRLAHAGEPSAPSLRHRVEEVLAPRS